VLIFECVANPSLIADSTTDLFKTGSTPGIPRQIGQVWLFGGAPNVVEHPQKIFVFVFNWA